MSLQTSRSKNPCKLKVPSGSWKYSCDCKTCTNRATAVSPQLPVYCIISKVLSGMRTISRFGFIRRYGAKKENTYIEEARHATRNTKQAKRNGKKNYDHRHGEVIRNRNSKMKEHRKRRHHEEFEN